MSLQAPAIAIAAVAAIIVVIVLGLRLLLRTARTRTESARARALAEPAARLGLIAIPDDQLSDLPPFELLNTGSDRRASNVLRGSVSGRSVVVFDYAFFDPTRPNERFRGAHYSRDLAGATICCVKGSWLSLPEFTMEPSLKPVLKQAEAMVDQQLGTGSMASTVHKLMEAAERMVVEAPGLEFAGRSEFPYRVRGQDEQAIRTAFTDRVLDFFRDHPGWIVEGRGDWLLVTLAMNLNQPFVTTRSRAAVRADQGHLPAEKLDTLVNAAVATLDAFGVRS